MAAPRPRGFALLTLLSCSPSSPNGELPVGLPAPQLATSDYPTAHCTVPPEAKAGELCSYPASAPTEELCILNPRTLARPPIGHPLLPPIPRTLRTAFPPIYHPLSALPGTRAQISTGVPSRSNVATPNAFSYPYTDALPSAPPHSSIPVSHADATSLLILLYSPYIARSTALTLDLSAWPLIMRARPPGL